MKVLYLLGGLILLLVILKMIWKDTALPAQSTMAAVDASTPEKRQTFKEQFMNAYANIAANEKTIYSHDLDTPDKMMEASLSFDPYSIIFKVADTSKDKDIVSLKKKAVASLIASQKKIFPMLRKKYYEFSKSLLWEHDIEVEISGANNTVLTFIGGAYAANARKQQTMSTIRDMVKALRFKRVNFKWIKHEDEFTYYPVESPSDVALK